MQQPNGSPGAGGLASPVSRLPADARRLTLLVGSPRSGTTWLAKILDTRDDVLYLHEPLRRIRDAAPGSALRRLTEGEPLGPSDRPAILADLAALQVACARPPFFPKRFRAWPTGALRLAWATSGLAGVGPALFRNLYRVHPSAGYDLLVKEVDWHPGLTGVDRLNPDYLVVLVRHPCAVVCSRLTGIRLGVMPEHDRTTWLALNRGRAEAAGFTAQDVVRMSPCEFYALEWLLENLYYRSTGAARVRCRTVVFEELCREPLKVAAELFDFLGWEMGERTRRFIRKSATGSWRESVLSRFSRRKWYFNLRRDSEKVARKWQAILTRAEVGQVMAVARQFPALDLWDRSDGPRPA